MAVVVAMRSASALLSSPLLSAPAGRAVRHIWHWLAPMSLWNVHLLHTHLSAGTRRWPHSAHLLWDGSFLNVHLRHVHGPLFLRSAAAFAPAAESTVTSQLQVRALSRCDDEDGWAFDLASTTRPFTVKELRLSGNPTSPKAIRTR